MSKPGGIEPGLTRWDRARQDMEFIFRLWIFVSVIWFIFIGISSQGISDGQVLNFWGLFAIWPLILWWFFYWVVLGLFRNK